MNSTVPTVKDIVGNKVAITTLMNWLESYYDGFSSVHYYVLSSQTPGNGLTFIPRCLANTFDVELEIFSVLNIRTMEDVRSFVQQSQSATLSGKRKLIVVKDVTSIATKLRNKLFKYSNFSSHPILFTTTELHKINESFTKNVVYIEKPELYYLSNFLKQKAKEANISISTEEARKIASEEPSVKCALDRVLIGISSSVYSFVRYKDRLRSLSKGRDVALDSTLLWYIMENIQFVASADYIRFVKTLAYLNTILDNYMNKVNELSPEEVKLLNLNFDFLQSFDYPEYYKLRRSYTAHSRKKEIKEIAEKLGVTKRYVELYWNLIHKLYNFEDERKEEEEEKVPEKKEVSISEFL